MKITEHNLHDNVYRTKLYVVICSDTDEWGKWLDKVGFTGERHEHKSKAAMFYRILPEESKYHNDTNVIFLRRQDISQLVHELVHFVFSVFDEKGIPTRIENDEAFAYYMEYWINTVREEWSELRKGKTEKPKKQSVLKEST